MTCDGCDRDVERKSLHGNTESLSLVNNLDESTTNGALNHQNAGSRTITQRSASIVPISQGVDNLKRDLKDR